MEKNLLLIALLFLLSLNGKGNNFCEVANLNKRQVLFEQTQKRSAQTQQHAESWNFIITIEELLLILESDNSNYVDKLLFNRGWIFITKEDIDSEVDGAFWMHGTHLLFIYTKKYSDVPNRVVYMFPTSNFMDLMQKEIEVNKFIYDAKLSRKTESDIYVKQPYLLLMKNLLEEQLSVIEINYYNEFIDENGLIKEVSKQQEGAAINNNDNNYDYNHNVQSNQVDTDKIFEIVEEPPSFPGGESAMYKWISENINYPVIAQDNNIQGRVTCQFVLDRNGEIEDIRVVRGVDPSLDKEAIRVIKSMPKWKPGKQGGHTVKVRYTLPVQFKLQ